MKRWIHSSEDVREYVVQYMDRNDHKYTTIVDAVSEDDATNQIEATYSNSKVVSVQLA